MYLGNITDIIIFRKNITRRLLLCFLFSRFSKRIPPVFWNSETVFVRLLFVCFPTFQVHILLVNHVFRDSFIRERDIFIGRLATQKLAKNSFVAELQPKCVAIN